jgi:ketosteroid isomerase-like protein
MQDDPKDVVRGYLDAMERRDLAAARAMLAPGFFMIFPGGRRFETIEALVEWSKTRYRRALKTYERFDVASQPDGSVVVYCFGVLHGERNDGSPYSGVRFVDRFSVRGGKLVDQMVWNDLVEAIGRPPGQSS